MSDMSAPLPPKLPVWRTVGEAYALWARNLPELVRIAWLWLLIMAPIVFIFMWWQAPNMMEMMQSARSGRPDPNPGTTVVMQAINSLILVPILSSIAVAWHRLLLRGEHVGGTYLRLDSVVIGYAVLFFVIGLLPAVPQYLGQIISTSMQPPGATQIDPANTLLTTVGGIATLVLWFFSCRLFMVLPAKALGRELGFGAAWAGTRRNSWRLFWGYFLCLLPLMLAGGVLGFWAVFGVPSRASMAAISGALSLLWVIFGMVSVGFLSLAYRHFFERSA